MRFTKFYLIFFFLPLAVNAQEHEDWKFNVTAYSGVSNFYFEGRNNIYEPKLNYLLSFGIEKDKKVSTAINLFVMGGAGIRYIIILR